MSEVFTSTVDLIIPEFETPSLGGDVVTAGTTEPIAPIASLWTTFLQRVEEQRREMLGVHFDAPVSTASGTISDEVVTVRAALRALESPGLTSLSAIVQHHGFPTTKEIEQLLSTTVGTPTAHAGLLRDVISVRERMQKSLNAGISTAAENEIRLVKQAVVAALADRGFSCSAAKRSPPPGLVQMRGLRDDVDVVLEYSVKTGQLTADFNSCKAGVCAREREPFLQALRLHGIQVRVLASHMHGPDTQARSRQRAEIFGAPLGERLTPAKRKKSRGRLRSR